MAAPRLEEGGVEGEKEAVVLFPSTDMLHQLTNYHEHHLCTTTHTLLRTCKTCRATQVPKGPVSGSPMAAMRDTGSHKVALVTGVTGQDGSYLAEFLLQKGYMVHGIIRRSSSFNTGRIDGIYKHPRLRLHYGDMTDGSCLSSIMSTVRPDEVYNLAAQSHVKVSFEMPEYTATADAVGVLKMLDAIRSSGLIDKTRFYQASTSELFGLVRETPQSETTPFYPRSPYACAKIYGYWIVVNYREGYNIWAANGILFNHESPRRGATFVTRKITRTVARISKGLEDCLYLGNLNALRDWGHARDYVEAMWLILQADQADDWCVGTGEQHSVREFCEMAFSFVGVDLRWRGEGVDEVGYHADDPDKIVIHERYFRPTEVETLLCNPAKIRERLGWRPRTTFPELVKEMMEAEMEALRIEPHPADASFVLSW